MASLPIAQPQPLTEVCRLSTKSERDQLLLDIKQALSCFQPNLEITPYSARHFVAVFSTEHISADVDFNGDDPAPSMIHWHKARAPLKPVPGVFEEDDINPCHRHKATSRPETFEELVEMLINGFSAANKGQAFISP